MAHVSSGQRVNAFHLAVSMLLACSGVAVSKWYFEETNTFLEVTGAIAFCQVKDAIHPDLIEMW